MTDEQKTSFDKKRKDNLKGLFYILLMLGGMFILVSLSKMYESWQREKNEEDLKINGRYTIGYYIYTLKKSSNDNFQIHYYYFVNGKYYRSTQSTEETPNYHPNQPELTRYFVIFSSKNPHISKFTNIPVPEIFKESDFPSDGSTKDEFSKIFFQLMKKKAN